MFSQLSPQGRARMPANLYHQVGVETRVTGANPHGLTLMLFDATIAAIKSARLALSDGRVADKARHVSHAARIIDEGLKAALNFGEGGELAVNLRDLYDYAQVRLMKANLYNDEAALKEVQALIEPVRDAWASIGASFPR